jgi:hypothetical protein
VAIERIEQLAEAVRTFGRERDWHLYHSPKNLTSALIVEAAELLDFLEPLRGKPVAGALVFPIGFRLLGDHVARAVFDAGGVPLPLEVVIQGVEELVRRGHAQALQEGLLPREPDLEAKVRDRRRAHRALGRLGGGGTCRQEREQGGEEDGPERRAHGGEASADPPPHRKGLRALGPG